MNTAARCEQPLPAGLNQVPDLCKATGSSPQDEPQQPGHRYWLSLQMELLAPSARAPPGILPTGFKGESRLRVGGGRQEDVAACA